MQLLLSLTLVVVSTYANQDLRATQQPPGIMPPGFDGVQEDVRENCLLDTVNGVEVTKELTDAAWDEMNVNGWPVKCKCAPYNADLFFDSPSLNRSPQKSCYLMGCLRNGKFIKAMETAHNCQCIPGPDTDIPESNFKYHCKKDDE